MERAVALLLALPLAGCLGAPPGEATCAATSYVTVHYDVTLEPSRVRATLESRGFAWRDHGDGTASVSSPRVPGIRGVVSTSPGLSGAGTVVSFESETDLPGGAGRARSVAQETAAVFNETFGGPPIFRWIEGVHETCPRSPAA